MNRKILLQRVFIFVLITLLLSGCGPGQMFGPTITPSPTQTPIPPTATNTNTPIPPTITNTPAPTQAVYVPQQMAWEDTLVFMKQKGYADLKMIEIGYLSMDGGQNYTDLMVKVMCMSGDCTSGTLYQWVIMTIEGFGKSQHPQSLATFHIQVYGQQNNLLEDVTGNWSDFMDYHNKLISMDQLSQRLVVVFQASTSTASLPTASTDSGEKPFDLAGVWKSDNVHAPDNSWNISYSMYFQFANTKQYVYHGVDTFNSNQPTDISDIVYLNINDSTFIKKLIDIPDHPEFLGKFQKWTWRFDNGNVLFTVYGMMDSQELALNDSTITALATGIKVQQP
jgi:hypothetical protein